jgi:hypothetical protein
MTRSPLARETIIALTFKLITRIALYALFFGRADCLKAPVCV